MDKRFFLILLAIVAAITGVFFFTRDKAKAPSPASDDISQHSQGQGTTSVELIEFGDFQCPACGSFFPIVQQVKEKYGDQIKFTFRNFPIDSIHPNARAAHRSAEAASLQGKFFEMHDLLYQNQSSWSSLSNPVPVFESLASSLALDLEKFKVDFASEAVNNTINADISYGKDVYGANSTPTFILDGEKLENSDIGSFELFSQKIDEAIASANKN